MNYRHPVAKVLGGLLLLIILPLLGAERSPATPLTIWIGSDKGYRGLEQIAQRYQAATGRTVDVRTLDNTPEAFERAFAQAQGPDILLWAHDRYGEWAQRGLIAPINPSPAFRKGIAGFAWDALTSDGRLYGYPIAIEAVGLIYNRRYTAEPPTHFEELPKLDQALRKFGIKAITWDYSEPYFSWSLLSANGGYAFKRVEGRYDTQHSGINQPGAILGADLLQQLLKSDVINATTDSNSVLNRFIDGKVAMMINGPWVWGELERRGIDFGVAPIPRVNGQPGKPFVGVWAAAIASHSPHKKQAVDFIENYMLSLEGLTTLNQDAPLGAVANRELMGVLAANPNIDTTFDNALNGQIMPNVPEMRRFWTALTQALKQIADGTPAAQALDQAQHAIATRP